MRRQVKNAGRSAAGLEPAFERVVRQPRANPQERSDGLAFGSRGRQRAEADFELGPSRRSAGRCRLAKVERGIGYHQRHRRRPVGMSPEMEDVAPVLA